MKNAEYAKNNMIPITPNEENDLIETSKKEVEKSKEREVKNIKLDRKELLDSMKQFDQPNCYIQKTNMTDDALAMWNILRQEPLINFRYPINFGEKRGQIQTATLNGLKFVIKSDYPIQVPQTIYNMFQEKLDAEHGAGDALDIDKMSEEQREKLTR
jgi:hypothetical protein